MKKFIIVGGIITGVGLLIWHFKNQIKLLSDFCYKIVGYRIGSLSRDLISFVVGVSIKNKSQFDISVQKYLFNIYINDVYVATAQDNNLNIVDIQTKQVIKNGILKGGNFGLLSIAVSIVPSDLRKTLNWDFFSKILLDQKNTKISLRGYITANFAGIKVKNLPIKIEMTVAEMMSGKAGPQPPCV